MRPRPAPRIEQAGTGAVLGAISPFGGHSPAVVFEVDKDGAEQGRQLVSDEGLADTPFSGVAYGDCSHPIIITL